MSGIVPRRLRPADLPALERFWPSLHDTDAPCAGELPPSALVARDLEGDADADADAEGADGGEGPAPDGPEIALGLFEPADRRGGADHLVGVARLRRWGRVVTLHGFAVEPERAGEGHEELLLAAVREEVERLDAAVVGAELAADDASGAAALIRAGFRAQPPTWLVERSATRATAVPDTRSRDDRPTFEFFGDHGPHGSPGSPGPHGPHGPHGTVPAPALDAVTRLAASLDSDLDPAAWIAAGVARGTLELIVARDEDGDSGHDSGRDSGHGSGPADDAAAACVAVLPATARDTLFASLVLLDPARPFERLAALLAELDRLAATRGRGTVALAVPTRAADATAALIERGFEPMLSRQRLTLRGRPERSNPSRSPLACWG